MTDENLISKLTDASSRRTFLKKGALTSAGLALGASSAGPAAAQDDGQGGQDGTQAYMFPNQFVPSAQLQVDAQIDWTPQTGQQGAQQTETTPEGQQTETEQDDDQQGNESGGGNESAFQDQGQTQTYVVQYSFSDTYYAFLFAPQDSNVQQGQTYQLGSDVTGADQSPIPGAVGVTLSQVDGGDQGGDDQGGDQGGDGADGGDGQGGDGNGDGDGGNGGGNGDGGILGGDGNGGGDGG